MPIDLDKKRIIMIHGLASKPPERDVHELWKRCVVENIRAEDQALAQALTKRFDTIDLSQLDGPNNHGALSWDRLATEFLKLASEMIDRNEPIPSCGSHPAFKES